MGNVSDKAPDVSILYQSRDPFRNVIQKPHGIAKEVHRAQDPRCLAEEFLSRGEGKQEDDQPVYTADSVPGTEADISLVLHTYQHQQPPFHPHQLQAPALSQAPPELLSNAHIPGGASNNHTFSVKIFLKAIQKKKKGMKQERFFTHNYISVYLIFPFPLFPQIGN